HFQLGLQFAIDEKLAGAASAELAGFIGSEFVAHIDFANGQGIARTDGVQFQPQQAVGVLQVTVFHVQRKTTKETGLSHDHARYSWAQSKRACPARIVEIGADAVGTIVDRRDHARRNVFSSVVVNEFRLVRYT